MVIDEPVPGVAPIDRYTDAVINNTKSVASSYTLVSREPLAAPSSSPLRPSMTRPIGL